MDIGMYIADLLRNQDAVSVPELGTFTKERIPGSYDRPNNSFLPPSYQVSFTDKLSDFSSLPEYISFRKNLSHSSAEYFIKKFTSGILDVLETSGIAEIKPLGIIRQKGNTLSFEPSATFNIAGKFYGLKPITDLKKAEAFPVNDPVAAAPTQGASIEDFINYQNQEEVENEEGHAAETKSNHTLFIILGTLVFGILAAGLLYFFNPQARNLFDSMFPGYVSTVPALPDSGRVNNTSRPVITDSVATSLPTGVPDSTLVDSVQITTEIIGAVFGKRSEAETYIETMKKKGFQARILEEMPGMLFKVSLGSFPDFQSAEQEFTRIRKEVSPDAWTTPYKSKKTQ